MTKSRLSIIGTTEHEFRNTDFGTGISEHEFWNTDFGTRIPVHELYELHGLHEQIHIEPLYDHYSCISPFLCSVIRVISAIRIIRVPGFVRRLNTTNKKASFYFIPIQIIVSLIYEDQ